MSVEQPKGVGDFNATWPRPTDSPTEGDDHIRLIKVQLNKIFAKFDKPLTMTSDQLNGVISKLKTNGVNLEVLSGLLTITPAASEAGKKAVNAEWVRQYATALMANSITHKDIASAIAAALTNYYTKAQSDARFAAKNHTHPLTGTTTVMVVRRELPSGTSGGHGTKGSWQPQSINKTQFNNIAGASLRGNTVTLPAGTYIFDQSATFDQTANTQTAILIGATRHYGACMHLIDRDDVRATLTTKTAATLSGTTNVQVLYRISNNIEVNSLGQPAHYGSEVYVQMTITKIA